MYYATFIYLLILVFIGKNFTNKTRFILAAFPLVLVAFLRYGVGADYFSYESLYESLEVSSINSYLNSLKTMEPIFKFLMGVFKFVGINYHIFIFSLSTFLVVLNLKWLYEISPNFEQSVLLQYSLLYIYWSLSAMRQGIVLSVLMYFFFNGKKRYSSIQLFAVTVLMMLVHVSAIIVPIYYLISKGKWNKKYFIVILLLSPVTRLIFDPQVMNLLASIPLIGKVARYADYNSIKFLSMPSLMRLSFIILILFHYDKLLEKYSERKRLIDFSLLGLISYFYLPLAMVIGTRVTIYSFCLIVIIFPMIVSLYEKTKLYIYSVIGFVSISSVSFYNEFSKLNARSGYNGSSHSLNFVTVFNGSRTMFDNSYAIDLEITDINRERLEHSNLLDRYNTEYNQVEAQFDSDFSNLPVRFGNGKFGIINSKGEVVGLPVNDISPKVYGKYIEKTIQYGDMRWKSYFEIGLDHLTEEEGLKQYTYIDLKDMIEKETSKELSFENSPVWYNVFYEKELESINFVNDIFYESSINLMRIFRYENSPEFTYLRISTDVSTYYIILKDGVPLVENLYKEVIPLNSSGIIIGRTKDGFEYINEHGSIIWYESIVKER